MYVYIYNIYILIHTKYVLTVLKKNLGLRGFYLQFSTIVSFTILKYPKNH